MTVGLISSRIRSVLAPKFGAAEARAMERVIFDDVLGLSPVDVAVNPDREMPEFVEPKIEAILGRLLGDEPLQYVIGRARFCGLEFEITPDVLIPRPETAELVDMIVDRHGSQRDLRILDGGTGSGCIAVALARSLKFPRITAIDISEAALGVARRNAAALGVSVDFVCGDMLDCQLDGPWDIIVSNPPYVMERERAEMEPHVADHEPARALFVPDDEPMKFYDALLNYARRVGAGAVYFEINPLCESRYKGAEIVRDSFGRKRFAVYDPF